MKNFIALLVFIGAGAAWYLYQEKQEASESLAQSQVQLSEIEKTILERRSEFQRYNTVASIQTKSAERKAELKALLEKLKGLRGQTDAVIQAQRQQIAVVRQAQIGKTVALTLSTGRALGQVRILKVEDSGVSVANADGIVKVLPSELPPELKKMLFY